METFHLYLSGRAPNGCPWIVPAPAGDFLRNEFAASHVCELSGSPVYTVVVVACTPPILEQREPTEAVNV